MPKKNMISVITITMLSFFLLPSFSLAQMHEYKDYTVVKGDTLWDISGAELKDPFLWPKIWKENPDIVNPDKIYPNQKIKIPLYILQKEIPVAEIPKERKPEIVKKLEPKKKEPKKEILRKIEPVKPVKKEYLVDKNILIASGYITDSVRSVGSIVSSPSGRTLLGKDDYAYVNTDKPSKIGDKFYIIRSAGKVSHPKYGYLLGYLIEVLGIAEVVGQDNGETKIIIPTSYADILIGSLLDDFYETEPPLLTDHPRKPDISAYIVATKELHMINGTWDIVYIDKGKKEGLVVGDLLMTIRQGEHRVVNSSIQIINLRESSATAIVKKANDIVSRGDEVVGIK